MRSHGRPLCELLRQQQEPFLLDVYLSERGLSERLLLPASSKSPSCTFCCRVNAFEKPQFLTSHGFIKYWKNALAWFHRNHHRRSSYSIDHYTAEVVISLPRKVVNIFNEILEAAHTPAFYQLIGSRRKLVEKESLHEKILLMVRQQKRLPCNKRHLVMPNSEFSILSSINLEWSGWQSDQVGEIGMEIGAELLEDIEEETILDMIGPYHCTTLTSSLLLS